MTAPPLTETCPSCGGVIDAAYCEICGEHRPSERIYTLRAFLHEAFEVVTNVERSFLKSLWTLVRRPGELTAAYMRGERVPYLKPLQLFLLINVVYFVWAGWRNERVFTTRLNDHLRAPYGTTARAIHAEREAGSKLTIREYHRDFDKEGTLLARSLIIVMVPAIALGVGLLSVRRRPRPPAVQHIVFSVHLLGTVLLCTMFNSVLLLLVFGAGRMVGPPPAEQTIDNLAGYIMLGLVGTHLFLAFRRAYEHGRGVAAVKTIVTLALLAYLLTGYRFLLFLVTSYSV